ncbi:uncharacterized protein LY89DRAFT_318152 [Mollisia scopiformis]|uniref:Uncharacterized protein n=1 Tax=Mollisia scopiformis TaxID=149040 RepID=A0A132BAZ6_MOLSC|nr:uncharacterized protein LY89DRAFT_318152 [Mollisia scopiformis]KUJ09014.1 hypothetical protein LY89DRAFT_318152 [Mollisia scopiformis]
MKWAVIVRGRANAHHDVKIGEWVYDCELNYIILSLFYCILLYFFFSTSGFIYSRRREGCRSLSAGGRWAASLVVAGLGAGITWLAKCASMTYDLTLIQIDNLILHIPRPTPTFIITARHHDDSHPRLLLLLFAHTIKIAIDAEEAFGNWVVGAVVYAVALPFGWGE